MLNSRDGLSLVEVLVSGTIGLLLAGGVMLAFLMSMKLSQSAVSSTEADLYAQQTIERFRNKIACRQASESQSDTWYNASCSPDVSSGTWIDDPLPGAAPIVQHAGTRQYRVTVQDCDGDGSTGDCLQVESKVAWVQPQ